MADEVNNQKAQTQQELDNAEFDALLESAEIVGSDKPIQWTPPPVPVGAGMAIRRTRQMIFLKAFSVTGNISESCKIAGINVSTERTWRGRDKWYLEQFKDALAAYKDAIEQEVHNRAIVGEQVPIIGKVQTEFGAEDRIIGHKTVKSDLLLMFHAKRHIPEYRDKYEAPKEEQKPLGTESPMARITIRLNMIGKRQQVEIPVAAQDIIDVTPESHQITEGEMEDDDVFPGESDHAAD